MKDNTITPARVLPQLMTISTAFDAPCLIAIIATYPDMVSANNCNSKRVESGYYYLKMRKRKEWEEAVMTGPEAGWKVESKKKGSA